MRTSASLALALPLALLAAAHDSDETLPAVGSEGGPARTMLPVEGARWLRGREVFQRAFTEEEGLGPVSNGESCAICHKLPTVGGAGPLEANVGNDRYGAGLRRAREQRFGAEVARQLFENCPPSDVPVPGGIQTPSVFGLGRIETIYADEILTREDPDDEDGDGIRGIASRLEIAGEIELGRFGWKATMPTVRDFVRNACTGELGITVPDERRGVGLVRDDDYAVDPEMLFDELDALVFFCAEIAAPARSGVEDDAVKRGEALFAEVGCAACHVPALMGSEGPVALYSDLLLHEVLPENEFERHFGKRRGEEEAEPERFRTPPLWGISKTPPYMHDGRAKTLSDAIFSHAGEATSARDRAQSLDEEELAALLAFLNDL